MKKILCAAVALLIAFTACACGKSGGKERFSSEIYDFFDTVTVVTAYDESETEFNEKLSLFTEKLSEYDGLYDIYAPRDSLTNLYTINERAGKAPVKADGRIIDLLEYGKRAYEFTLGKVNICMGPVLSLWHECREEAAAQPDSARLPDTSALEKAAKHTDTDDLIINEDDSTVFFADPDMKLDAGAIAKGYAAEKLAEWAKENLWSSAVINIGGNVCAFGSKNDDGETPWKIGVESPKKSAENYAEIVEIREGCVVTSGDYQRFYTVNGKKYCHIIDPATLMPAEYVSSVTVVCENSALADALSTALFNMDIDRGKALVDGMNGVEALWIDKEGEKYYSSGFKEYIKK